MEFILILVVLVVLIAFIVSVCTQQSNVENKKKQYSAECARQELLQKQDKDINLDGEED